jgi:hypothetical protein
VPLASQEEISAKFRQLGSIHDAVRKAGTGAGAGAPRCRCPLDWRRGRRLLQDTSEDLNEIP